MTKVREIMTGSVSWIDADATAADAARQLAQQDVGALPVCDGAGHLRIFWSIALPLSRPLMAALVIFTFMWRWNEFVWPLIVLTDANAYTLPVGLQFLISQFGSDFGPLLAMSFLSILPMLVVFAIFQKYFVQGVARTGLK